MQPYGQLRAGTFAGLRHAEQTCLACDRGCVLACEPLPAVRVQPTSEAAIATRIAINNASQVATSNRTFLVGIARKALHLIDGNLNVANRIGSLIDSRFSRRIYRQIRECFPNAVHQQVQKSRITQFLAGIDSADVGVEVNVGQRIHRGRVLGNVLYVGKQLAGYPATVAGCQHKKNPSSIHRPTYGLHKLSLSHPEMGSVALFALTYLPV
jgi:hypothetical protein